MKPVIEALERTPVIAATDRVGWQSAVLSDAEVLFHLGADIITVSDDIKAAKQNSKFVFIHIDLADGIGKDKAESIGSKHSSGRNYFHPYQLIRAAHDSGLLAVQRFFILDSKGMHSISETIENTCPDLIEIMPGYRRRLKLLPRTKSPLLREGLLKPSRR
ncbi:MAG: glycerol-3-phosphate responsive antiterminator [Oscillospiraceae bacterium]